jgi:hypothetical protein
MTPVRADRVDAKRGLADSVFDAFDGVSRVMMATDLRGSRSRGVIDGHVLKAPDSVPVGGLKAHNLHVRLTSAGPQIHPTRHR